MNKRRSSKRRRQYLGQHFLKSQQTAKKIVDSAEISPGDIVLEIGSGKGILLPLLCEKAKKVISYEKDPHLFTLLKSKLKNLENLEMVHGDGFTTRRQFSVFVSNLPYSKSRRAIEWLVLQKFSKAVIMIQREFGDKLLTANPRERKAVTVLANYCFNMEKISRVNKREFEPEPQVDSIILKITKKKRKKEKEEKYLTPSLIQIVNRIFSYRRKKIANILEQFEIKKSNDQERLDNLSTEEIIDLAKKIQKNNNN